MRDETRPIDRTVNQARAGVTGHNVRSVLAANMFAVIILFDLIAYFFF